MVLEYGFPLRAADFEVDPSTICLHETPQVFLRQHFLQEVWKIVLAQTQLFNHDALRCGVPALADEQLIDIVLEMRWSDIAQDMENNLLRQGLEMHDGN